MRCRLDHPPHGSLPSCETQACLANLPWAGRPVHISSRARRAHCKSTSRQGHGETNLLKPPHLVPHLRLARRSRVSSSIRLDVRPQKQPMLSSSQRPVTAGPALSTTSLVIPIPQGRAHPFFPNRRNVVPPTGAADRGPSMSHIVKVICELSGRSQYRIGSVIHSFHLHPNVRANQVYRHDDRLLDGWTYV